MDFKSVTTLKTVNDVEKLYAKGIIHLKNTDFLCPVCGKTYKHLHTAEKHLEKRDCHTMQQLMEGTIHEAKGLGLYQELIASLNPKATVSLAKFRKSTMYKPVMRFIMFCVIHQVFDIRVYLDWLNQIKAIHNLPTILSQGTEEPVLREFRDFAQLFSLMDSEKFFKMYGDRLRTDDDFFVRSIEKSLIGLIWLANHKDFPMDERVEGLPIGYKDRVMAVAEKLL